MHVHAGMCGFTRVCSQTQIRSAHDPEHLMYMKYDQLTKRIPEPTTYIHIHISTHIHVYIYLYAYMLYAGACTCFVVFLPYAVGSNVVVHDYFLMHSFVRCYLFILTYTHTCMDTHMLSCTKAP